VTIPRRIVLTAALTCALLVAGHAHAADNGSGWVTLTPTQQQALAPLQREWGGIDANQKRKWLELASRFPTMSADERERVRQRMVAWTRMTPSERAGARLQFQETKNVPVEERTARWQAYQALSEDERRTLAQRARPSARAPSAADVAKRPRALPEVVGQTGKRNVVVAPPPAPARVVAPTVVQAKPGATTTTMSTRASPPPHHQAGLPKIAATPGFVDPATLLPQRGPQGAAVRAAAPSDAASQP
jgi:Protein of unknown function (DUF3106)